MLFVVPRRGRRSALLVLLFIGLYALAPSFCFAADSVILAWDPSPDPVVIGYNVYYGAATRSYTNMVSAGNATNATVSGLVPGMAYYFAATATDATGLESDYSNEVTYSVPIVTPNQPPTLNALANLTINENAGLQTVNLAGITSGAANEVQTLTVTATSGNTGLVPNPAVNYTSPNATGSLSFTPVPFASGSTTITVILNDGGASNNIITRSFVVTVSPVNQAPTLNALSNLTINENAGVQTINLAGITSGAANELQTLAVTATSGNMALLPNPTVNYTSPNTTGSLSFTPVAYANGSTTITVTVNDGGASNNIVTRSFAVTVSPVNQAPTLNSLSDLTINENAGMQTVNLSGITSGAGNEVQTLTVNATSGSPGVIPKPTVSYISPSATGSLSFTPVANAYGSVAITVTVNDGGASNNIVTRSFTVAVNQPPTISTLTNLVITMDAQTPAIPFTISDAETAASSLTLSGTSSNTALVQSAAIIFGGTGANRTVTVTPLAGQSGYASITVTVSDGFATASSTFQLGVQTKPAPPGNFHLAGQ
jgi:Bacterial Ig domain/Fibronectin type III domain